MTVRDPEVLDALRDEPELLAIADAVASTVEPPRRRRVAPVLAAAACAAAALVLLVVEPWGGGGPSLAGRAFAAIGDGPIVHAVIRYRLPGQRVELATGKTEPIVRTVETWADEEKGLVLVVTRADGEVVSRKTLRLEAETFYPLGLAAHYREALEQGKLRKVREGIVRGRSVIWVAYSDSEISGEAALDSSTYDPLVLRYLRGGRVLLQIDVLKMESVGRGAVRFGSPVDDGSTGTGLAPAVEVPAAPPSSGDIEAAREVLSTPPLWLGRSYRGSDLTTLSVGTHEISSGGRVARAETVHVAYGNRPEAPPFALDELNLRKERDFIRVEEDVVPPEGYVDLEGPSTTTTGGREFERWRGTLRRGDLYVTIEAGSRPDVLAAARALRPAR